MTTKTLTLTDFLLARIAEDAEVALSASNAPWLALTMYPTRSEVVSESASDEAIVVTPRKDDFDVEHIARHDPARVLAECEAKRRIVEWCGGREMIWVGTIADYPFDPKPEQFVPGPLKNPADSVVLRALASVYADHPDYRDEWRP